MHKDYLKVAKTGDQGKREGKVWRRDLQLQRFRAQGHRSEIATARLLALSLHPMVCWVSAYRMLVPSIRGRDLS